MAEDDRITETPERAEEAEDEEPSPDAEEDDGSSATPESDEEGGGVETSLEELLQRKERRGKLADEEDDEEALLDAMEERDSRASESLTVKVIPPQPTEFTCRGCFLLKARSQLKNKKRMLCNDCA